jgi:hypothetical protein
MAYALVRQGDIQQARQMFDDSIRRAQQAGFTIALVFAVEGLASLNVNQKSNLNAPCGSSPGRTSCVRRLEIIVRLLNRIQSSAIWRLSIRNWTMQPLRMRAKQAAP